MLRRLKALDDCDHLADLGFVGPTITWNNKRGGGANVQERLDRYVVNSDWRLFFPEARVSNLSFSSSDHRPITLDLFEWRLTDKKNDKYPFRFEEWWVKEQGCCKVSELEWDLEIQDNMGGLAILYRRN